MHPPLVKRLNEKPTEVLILDGGQGTELENRGIDISSPIWSTVPFLKENFWDDSCELPEKRILKEMFEAYIYSGAQILTTLTYQTSYQIIKENTEVKTLKEYDHLITNIVQFCRKSIGSEKYLVGSIGSYAAFVGAEYSGDYGKNPSKIDFFEYFRPQLENFNKNPNIDIIGFETIPNYFELKTLLSWDEKKVSKPFFIGLSMNDNATLRDGTSMATVGTMLRERKVKNKNLTLIGINCCSYGASLSILSKLHKEIPDVPLIVYCNGGGTYHHDTQTWTDGSGTPQWQELVPGFISNGARIIGGCCKTTPIDIQHISEAVKKVASS